MTLLRAGKDASPVSFSILVTVPSPQSTSSSAERAASNEGRVCQPRAGAEAQGLGGPAVCQTRFMLLPSWDHTVSGWEGSMVFLEPHLQVTNGLAED